MAVLPKYKIKKCFGDHVLGNYCVPPVLQGVGRCQKVGEHRHVIYVPSVKNQYKRVVFGYISGVGRCQKV